ncbi:Gst,Glutathione S-transferase [Alternaria alternata]|nr:Gst,Glutathione S-transferase [Alternaria alternata]
MITFDIILRRKEQTGGVALTVDSNGDALREDKAVSALECRDLAELVELQVVLRDTLGRLGVDELDVETILLRDGQERGGTRVTLLARC